ncbi:MAG TPA: S41 family peptidase [Candidatus Baltobacteraceae bacterium]
MNRFAPIPCAALALLLFQTAPSSAAAIALSPQDGGEIAFSYQQLTQGYYEKTNPQAILDSARRALLAALAKAHVAKATLPPLIAAGDPAANARAVVREVEVAGAQAKGKISAHALSYTAMAGMLASVKDPYTVFLDPKEYAALNGDLNGGDFGGIGVVIESDDVTKYIVASEVVPDSPADRAGVRQGDLLETIDGVSTKGKTIQQASAQLRGKAGTSVTIGLAHDAAPPVPVTIQRGKIHELSVYDKMLPGKIGYVELTVFGRTTGAELSAALARLQAQGARAFVMDLRNNGGGYLDAAVAVSSKFIPSGPIVSEESRASQVTTYEADDTAIAPLPLAVLVNGYTASASEITTGAIQDDGAGTIVGTRTFGKGVVQNVFPMPDGSAIKITTARYLTPRNRNINHVGIVPDIVLAENKTPLYGNPARDAQLQRAIDYLNDRIAHLGGEGSPAPPGS